MFPRITWSTRSSITPPPAPFTVVGFREFVGSVHFVITHVACRAQRFASVKNDWRTRTLTSEIGERRRGKDSSVGEGTWLQGTLLMDADECGRESDRLP